MAKLIIVSGAAEGQSFELDKEVLVVGRDPSCDIVLDHPDVSRRHAELQVGPDGVVLKDLGSTNGTKVAGAPVTEMSVGHGTEIDFAGVKARLEMPGASAQTRVAGAATRVSAAAPSLMGSDGQAFPLNKDVVLVGRESGCDLVLNQESVSARHAELRVTPQGVMVKDLGSTNGTYVNGLKVSEKLLTSGDELAFDVVKFMVNIPGAAGTRAGAAAQEPSVAMPTAPAKKSTAGLTVSVVAVLLVVALVVAWYFLYGPGMQTPEQTAQTAPAQTAQTTQEAQPAPAAEAKPAPAQPAATGGVIDPLVFNLVWSFRAQDRIFSSPAVGDVDGNGSNDVVVGSNDGNLYAVNGKTGQELWRFQVGQPVVSSPALVDLTGDNVLDVVVGSDGARVYAVEGTERMAGASRKIWEGPAEVALNSGIRFRSSPAVTDLTANGRPDILVGGSDARLYALEGGVGRTIWATDTNLMTVDLFASPALYDVNGDGTPDALQGAMNNNFYCINGKNGWKIWEFATKNQVKASPALADVNNDGKKEVVIASMDGTIYVVQAADGVEVWRWECGQSIEASPAVADVNRDGVPDVIAVVSNGLLAALNGTNGRPVWQVELKAPVVSSPAVYDLNRDGVDDIVVADRNNVVHVISGTTGWELANFRLTGPAVSSPSLADINHDGMLDLAIGTSDNNVVVLTLNRPVPPGTVVWGGFRKNNARTGN